MWSYFFEAIPAERVFVCVQPFILVARCDLSGLRNSTSPECEVRMLFQDMDNAIVPRDSAEMVRVTHKHCLIATRRTLSLAKHQEQIET